MRQNLLQSEQPGSFSAATANAVIFISPLFICISPAKERGRGRVELSDLGGEREALLAGYAAVVINMQGGRAMSVRTTLYPSQGTVTHE